MEGGRGVYSAAPTVPRQGGAWYLGEVFTRQYTCQDSEWFRVHRDVSASTGLPRWPSTKTKETRD